MNWTTRFFSDGDMALLCVIAVAFLHAKTSVCSERRLIMEIGFASILDWLGIHMDQLFVLKQMNHHSTHAAEWRRDYANVKLRRCLINMTLILYLAG